MCHALDKVVQLAMSTFPKSENFLHKLERLLAQTNQLTGKDVGLDKSRSMVRDSKSIRAEEYEDSLAPVTYIPVTENPVISVGIFIVHEGERIPMHDHPNMYGIIKCLQGHLRISSLTRKETQSRDLPEKFSAEIFQRKIQTGQLFLAEPHLPVLVNSESPPCILKPDMGNIHQIESVNGAAAFLDILSPPYNIDPEPDSPDQQERDCNYYRVIGEEREGGKTWLIQIPSPTNFFCDTESYQGPQLSRDPADY
eukprot:TRINITY_DN4887_c0_g2_i1.p1 TRINITY_DN4887_c0_g2~~TRINITY_DN4887_c0_g2_i1.p1  ORF type:complete len:253 (+),score=36.98 TRINITY_DN4887_c0_g2_i1:63-821(+)